MSGAIQKSLYRALPPSVESTERNIEVKSGLPLLHPERHMVGFESDEAIFQNYAKG